MVNVALCANKLLSRNLGTFYQQQRVWRGAPYRRAFLACVVDGHPKASAKHVQEGAFFMAEATDWNKKLEALEARLWESADALRSNSKLDATDYCMPVMGLIFLRYAWGRFHRVTEELEQENILPNGRRIPIEKEDYLARGVLWLPETARYNRLAALPGDENLAEALNAAMIAIEAESPTLAGVLPKQYGELPPNVLADLVRTFNDPVLDTIGGDVFGRIYEYFLQQFAPWPRPPMASSSPQNAW